MENGVHLSLNWFLYNASTMRVIAGLAKRRGLKSVSKSHGVRPILARIKKSLFDILQPRLPGAAFLDLFAGSGAVGIEALSRGAESVTFVDKNPVCLSVIRQNLSRLGLSGKARVIKGDAAGNLHSLGGTYDIIFMGPPYHDQNWNALHLTAPALRAIAEARVLRPGGIVVGQHHSKELPVDDPAWELYRQEKYGDTRLSFFRPCSVVNAEPSTAGDPL